MATKGSGDRLMTLAELAGYLHVSKKTALELVQSGQIPTVAIGEEFRFRRAAIDEWLDRQSSGNGESFEEITDATKLPLGDFLPDTGIVHEMRARDALGAIEELAGRAYQNRWLADKPWFIGALVEREALASTAMEGGVAFLHTRARDTKRIARPFVIMGRSYDGIDFGAPDGKPTHLFFLLGLTHDRLHLPILGRLARLMMRNPATIGKLRATTSPTTMRATLLKMDADALAETIGSGVDYKKSRAASASGPVLDRGVRLRAIMRLTARRKQEKRKDEAAKTYRSNAKTEPTRKRPQRTGEESRPKRKR
jgi:excisionase family DNA binding protein